MTNRIAEYNKSFVENKVYENLIVFESCMGENYAGSPKAIYEQLANDERYKEYVFVWSFNHPKQKKSIPALRKAIRVKKGSEKYYTYCNQAKYIVCDTRPERDLWNKDGQIYIDTDAERLKEGCPANDFLINFTDQDVYYGKKKLGIERINKKVILYMSLRSDGGGLQSI